MPDFPRVMTLTYRACATLRRALVREQFEGGGRTGNTSAEDSRDACAVPKQRTLYFLATAQPRTSLASLPLDQLATLASCDHFH